MITNTDLLNRFDWRKKQQCHHCGCQVIRDKHLKTLNENSATIDHIHPNTDIRRMCINGNKWVLSCHGCNKKRSKADRKRLYALFYELDLYERSVLILNTFYRCVSC